MFNLKKFKKVKLSSLEFLYYNSFFFRYNNGVISKSKTIFKKKRKNVKVCI